MPLYEPAFNDIAIFSSPGVLSPEFINRVEYLESNFNPYEQTGSYKGPMQFSNETMREWNPNYTNIWSRDEQITALTNEMVSKVAALEAAIGRPPTAMEAYMTHQQGLQGTINLLTANVDLPAAQVRTTSAILGNITPAMRTEFGEDITVGEFLSGWNGRFNQTAAAEVAARGLPGGPVMAGPPISAQTAPIDYANTAYASPPGTLTTGLGEWTERLGTRAAFGQPATNYPGLSSVNIADFSPPTAPGLAYRDEQAAREVGAMTPRGQDFLGEIVSQAGRMAELGYDMPSNITATSGMRSSTTDARTHPSGLAVDLRVNDLSPDEVRNQGLAAMAAGATGLGLYGPKEQAPFGLGVQPHMHADIVGAFGAPVGQAFRGTFGDVMSTLQAGVPQSSINQALATANTAGVRVGPSAISPDMVANTPWGDIAQAMPVDRPPDIATAPPTQGPPDYSANLGWQGAPQYAGTGPGRSPSPPATYPGREESIGAGLGGLAPPGLPNRFDDAFGAFSQTAFDAKPADLGIDWSSVAPTVDWTTLGTQTPPEYAAPPAMPPAPSPLSSISRQPSTTAPLDGSISGPSVFDVRSLSDAATINQVADDMPALAAQNRGLPNADLQRFGSIALGQSITPDAPFSMPRGPVLAAEQRLDELRSIRDLENIGPYPSVDFPTSLSTLAGMPASSIPMPAPKPEPSFPAPPQAKPTNLDGLPSWNPSWNMTPIGTHFAERVAELTPLPSTPLLDAPFWDGMDWSKGVPPPDPMEMGYIDQPIPRTWSLEEMSIASPLPSQRGMLGGGIYNMPALTPQPLEPMPAITSRTYDPSNPRNAPLGSQFRATPEFPNITIESVEGVRRAPEKGVSLPTPPSGVMPASGLTPVASMAPTPAPGSLVAPPAPPEPVPTTPAPAPPVNRFDEAFGQFPTEMLAPVSPAPAPAAPAPVAPAAPTGLEYGLGEVAKGVGIGLSPATSTFTPPSLSAFGQLTPTTPAPPPTIEAPPTSAPAPPTTPTSTPFADAFSQFGQLAEPNYGLTGFGALGVIPTPTPPTIAPPAVPAPVAPTPAPMAPAPTPMPTPAPAPAPALPTIPAPTPAPVAPIAPTPTAPISPSTQPSTPSFYEQMAAIGMQYAPEYAQIAATGPGPFGAFGLGQPAVASAAAYAPTGPVTPEQLSADGGFLGGLFGGDYGAGLFGGGTPTYGGGTDYASSFGGFDWGGGYGFGGGAYGTGSYGSSDYGIGGGTGANAGAGGYY